MADEIREQVIVDVKIEGADNEKQVTTLTKNITLLKTETSELVKNNKELEKAGKANSKEYIENSKQIEINKQKIRENTASQKNLITTLISEDKSIKALQVRNRELVKQRNELSTATAHGRAQIALINKEMEENSETIRANSSAQEQQRMNIGNYASALDNLIPGLGSVASGQNEISGALMGTINPMLGVIAGAGALFAAYVKSTTGARDFAFAQDRLANMTSRVLEAFGTMLGGTGAGGSGPLSKLVDLMGNAVKFMSPLMVVFSKQIDNFLEESRKAAQAAENLELLKIAAIDAAGFAKVFERTAEEARRVRDDSSKSFEERMKAVATIEQNMTAMGIVRVNNLKDQREALIQANVNWQNNLDILRQVKEIDAQIADIEEDVTGKLTENTTAVAALRKEYEELNKTLSEQGTKERLEAYDRELSAAHEAYLAEKEIRDQKDTEEEELHQRVLARMAKEKKEREQDSKNYISQETAKLNFAQMVTNARIGLAETVGFVLGQLSGKNKALAITGILIEKAAAIAGIISNTALANLKAIATSPLTFGQPWVAVNTATGIVAGVGVAAQAAKSISDIAGFAKGGAVSGTRIRAGHGTPIRRSNGDDVLITAKRNEVILNEQHQAALGGAATFKAIGVPGFADGGITGFNQTAIANRRASQMFDINGLTAAIQSIRVAVAVEDINTGQSNFAQVVNKASLN